MLYEQHLRKSDLEGHIVLFPVNRLVFFLNFVGGVVEAEEVC